MAATEKVKKYEEFLNERLTSDLNHSIHLRDTVYTEIAHYQQLKESIDKIIQSKQKSIKTLIDIGANFYMQAKVPDTTFITVSIGLGFYLEMTLNDALTFIQTKTQSLHSKADKLSQDIADIRSRMTLVLEGLREIQSLPAEAPETPHRDIWT